MPRAVPIRTDIWAAELRRRAEIEADGRASRRMLALTAVLEGASQLKMPRTKPPPDLVHQDRL